MKKNRDSWLIVSVAFLLCIFRVIVKESIYLNDIMAVFNLFAIAFSVWCMFNDAEDKLKEKNDKNPLGKEVLKYNKKFLKRFRIFTEFILFFVCSPIYLLCIKDSTGNDILTIIALCFALETNVFSDKLSSYCYLKA